MIEVTPETRALLTLSMIKGVGPAALRDVRVSGLADTRDLRDHLAPSKAAKIDNTMLGFSAAEASRQIERCRSAGVRIISALDADYPGLLAATRDDPRILFVKGKLAPSPGKSVAVIGTREPTEHGKIIAERVASYVATEGWSVVSGLALGCDTIAHEAALRAGGHTVAVLAHGLQTVAPSGNRDLAERIVAAGGALISEFRFGQAPLPQQFAKRDRTQAGLAQGVIMIQSDVVGGSLHASRASLEYHRWLAVPCPTERDVSHAEPKIEANLVLAGNSMQEKTELLKCDAKDLDRLVILRGRNDYGRLLRPSSTDANISLSPAVQASLF